MARPSHPLAPLHIPPHLSGIPFNQQPFSPALPPALQPSFQHQHPPALPMHTPIQPFFQPQPPLAPVRPSHHHSASMAPMGSHQPAVPITPLGGHFPRPSMAGLPFPNRNRRQPSIGGPPKAVLGGPTRKLSPLPPPAPPAPVTKTKKVIVNLPSETIVGENGESSTRAPWARYPQRHPMNDWAEVVYPPIVTRDVYPPEQDYILPSTIEVFLPGKALWEPLRNRVIEEKLEKLGVIEKSSGSNVPHIFAPHARAASISSPADPALLYFKLNKLQQSQAASASNSNNVSPQPPFLTPSPQLGGQFYSTSRHGHSLSLMQPPSQSFADTQPSTGTFGPDEIFGDHTFETTQPGLSTTLHSQSLSATSLIPYGGSTRPSSRPDFNRGFGLDIPEEEESEDESYSHQPEGAETETEAEVEAEEDPLPAIAPPVRSTVHSRHVSRLSAALSLISVGGPAHENSSNHPAESDIDAVAEWTGSEDLYEFSDDSIGEWSNPSDEERARQERAERRSRRRAALAENEPRRLPKFPRPPKNTLAIPVSQSEDVLSNPSDDDHLSSASRYPYLGNDLYNKSPSTSGISSRPLPPLPHSRLPSGQFSIHDPAYAHSRTHSTHEDTEVSLKKSGTESLNPLAKPFVFGVQNSASISQSVDDAASKAHIRLPTFGKPLSAAAAEFKPVGFTFKPPAGGPQLSFPTARPLPEVPEPSARAQQGREKRQRLGSSSIDEGDSMVSFRFPANNDSDPPLVQSPEPIRPQHRLNPAAPVFTLGAKLSHDFAITEEDAPAIQAPGLDEETLRVDASPREDSAPKASLSQAVSPSGVGGSPIGLDYRHPVSQNTVPAGLFKALVNGDEKTRRTVRSRLGSREFFETLRRPSLDDLHMDSMSRSSRQRFIAETGAPSEDIFGASHIRRRSSLPNSLHTHSPTSSRMSADSMPAIDLTGKFEQNRYEDKFEAILDRKIASLKRQLASGLATSGGATLNPTTEAAIKEVVSLFRFQLQESASRGLDESHFEARGEIDLAMFKDIVEQSNKETLKHMQSELRQFSARANSGPAIVPDPSAFTTAVKEMSRQTVESVKAAVAQSLLSQSSLGHEIVNQIAPTLNSLRPEPVDYEMLTARLSQAVKPHISQLIDLASDKRETAGLIVDRILPLLPNKSSSEPPFDVDALTLQLTTEIRRAIAPIDAFEIKEQVADLVIERLDSRLAVRDKSLNSESVSSKVVESIRPILEPITDLVRSTQEWAQHQQTLVSNTTAANTVQSEVAALIRQIPTRFDELSKKARGLDTALPLLSSTSQSLDELKAALIDLKKGQDAMLQGKEQHLEDQNTYSHELRALPSRIEENLRSILNAQREHDLSSLAELEELRKANAEYQAQLVKARAAHGQVRVEKDAVEERLKDIEADRENLRLQVKELQTSLSMKSSDAGAWETKAHKFEQALAQALTRLQIADVEQQNGRERVSTLENSNREILAEKMALSSKVETLEARLALTAQEAEVAAQNYASLQTQHNLLINEQTHWQDLHRIIGKVEELSTASKQAESQELLELREARIASQALEAEHESLQHRCKELENRAAQTEKLIGGLHLSLSQSQQRSSEWEQRAKEVEGHLELTRTQLEQSEQRHSQLENDYSLTKLQLEEREADDRLSKDRERHFREQITALEAKVKTLQTELQTKLRPPYRNGVLSTYIPSRPDSRASTVMVDYDGPATSRGTATPPNQPSVWDSIHAPMTNGHSKMVPHTPTPRLSQISQRVTPKNRALYDYKTVQRQATASPTPSVVSVAPTLGDDGWWA